MRFTAPCVVAMMIASIFLWIYVVDAYWSIAKEVVAMVSQSL